MLDSPEKEGLEAKHFPKNPSQFKRQEVMMAVHWGRRASGSQKILGDRSNRTC